eukprot:9324195-Pyramimonas_sp.AAC.2
MTAWRPGGGRRRMSLHLITSTPFPLSSSPLGQRSRSSTVHGGVGSSLRARSRSVASSVGCWRCGMSLRVQ